MESTLAFYAHRIAHFTLDLKKIQKKHQTVSLLRLTAFLVLVLSWFWLFTIFPLFGASLGSLLILTFFILLKWHKKLEDKRDLIAKMLEINQEEHQALQGKIDAFDAGHAYVNHQHPYSYDMDLFGDESLFQFINRTISSKGSVLLANWLAKTPLPNNLIEKHQKAIKELAPQTDFRQWFRAQGKLINTSQNEDALIKKWLQTPSFFKRQKLAQLILYAIPCVNLSLFTLSIFGIVPASVIVYIVLINLSLIATRLKTFNKTYALLNKSLNNLKKMLQLLQLIEGLELKTELLVTHKSSLFKNQVPASKQIKQLTQLLDALDNRNNLIVGIVLNAFLLWDWNLLFRIEKWRQNHDLDYEAWQNTIAYFDALNSLAGFSFNHASYTFPTLVNESFVFEAESIGHPMLPATTRICNDFALTEKPRYAIVTGANMAGKSTFLRTIAANLVLAGCGAPVCAKKLHFKPLPLYSSMRTEDSLMKNESYFFAELKRLQQITKELEKGQQLFIILDEILRGTNSEDKRKGSIGFVKKITKKMAYGLVATHDLELARLAEQQPGVFKALCFEVTFSNNELKFDYKLQPGVTKNMNASFLMERMGIIDSKDNDPNPNI